MVGADSGDESILFFSESREEDDDLFESLPGVADVTEALDSSDAPSFLLLLPWLFDVLVLSPPEEDDTGFALASARGGSSACHPSGCARGRL